MIAMNRTTAINDFKWVIKVLDSSESKEHMDTTLKCFTLWENKHVDKSLTILDGQHRWNALKRVNKSLLPEITVQIDVIVFKDDDEDIMGTYKNINTNVPIDQSRLNEEMEYVTLVEEIKKVFPKGIKNFSKELKDPIPEHFVVDLSLKEELQYRQVLNWAKPKDIIDMLAVVNETIKRDASLQMSLNLIDGKICKRDNMFLGVQWPLSINLLEEEIKKSRKK